MNADVIVTSTKKPHDISDAESISNVEDNTVADGDIDGDHINGNVEATEGQHDDEVRVDGNRPGV